ncbi:Gfo/Idh/MocA family protein [Sphaerisporangium fuscum]|uniref:Gfo/Idh/MocA family protein n=1 Tax=Sphaerisporangium fuscum TaxID=2835868 RepID=UPI001BDBEED1|nr:Gfo/Idh/MocA family oxidoreductase [Sphaerisporangium fuscum]
MLSMKAAIIGLAHVHVRDHLAVIEEDPGLHLAAVWDPDAERTRALPREMVVGDLRTAVNRADIVIIDSVTGTHVDLVPVVASAGKPVFVEKPLGRHHEESRHLAAVIEQAGVPFATGYFLRCLPALRRVRDLLRDGRLGRLVRVHAEFGHSGWRDGVFSGPAAWMIDPDQAGFGGFGDLGTHLLDTLLWLRPDHRLRVRQAQLTTVPALELDIGGSAVLAWDDDVHATITASWDTHPGGLRVLLEGTVDTATVDDGTLTLASGPSWTGEGPDARTALRAFIADIRGQASWDPPSPRQPVSVARLLDDAYRTATRSSK